MRVTVGTIAVLGLAVAVAAAQPPVQRERAATLKPPQALAPGDLPVARGTIDDFPPPPRVSSTPVVRPVGASGRGPGIASGPGWAGGTDTNVQPAANVGARVDVLPPPLPRAPVTNDPPAQAKLLDRVKTTFTGEKPPAPKALPQPVAQVQPETPTAATAFRGTGSNGAPVFAGPPAYRWYGWGSVTPGANPLAPAGQYPKASANWYSITGATPGAFPVPVANPSRTLPGNDPPTYGLAARTPPATPPAAPVASSQPAAQYIDRAEAPRPPAPPEARFLPGQGLGLAPAAPVFTPPAPVGVPVLTPPPLPKSVAVAAARTAGAHAPAAAGPTTDPEAGTGRRTAGGSDCGTRRARRTGEGAGSSDRIEAAPHGTVAAPDVRDDEPAARGTALAAVHRTGDAWPGHVGARTGRGPTPDHSRQWSNGPRADLDCRGARTDA